VPTLDQLYILIILNNKR